MPGKDSVRYVISVEDLEEEVGHVVGSIYGTVNFGGDTEGALAEGLRIVAWFREQAAEFEYELRKEFGHGPTDSDVQG